MTTADRVQFDDLNVGESYTLITRDDCFYRGVFVGFVPQPPGLPLKLRIRVCEGGEHHVSAHRISLILAQGR